jgi:hypothetical protein
MLGNVDLGQQAQQIGLPILHGHIYTSTLWIMTRGIREEVGAWPRCDILLIDRAVPDALGYYLAALDYRSETPDEAAITHLRTLGARVQPPLRPDLPHRPRRHHARRDDQAARPRHPLPHPG